MLPETTLVRLETQCDVVQLLLHDVDQEALRRAGSAEQWSAHEHLAHLARHHAIFLERLHRIIDEETPEIARYRAEEDSSWGEWSSLSTDQVVGRLQILRAEILNFIKGLSEAELQRAGVHPALGQMDVTHWAEFFLLHEAHHLYKVMLLLGQTKTLRIQ